MKQGAIWTLTAAVVGAVGTLLVTPQLIRALGVADFGLYVLVLTITSYAAFLDLGLPWAATRFFAEDLAHGRMDVLVVRFHTLARFLLAVSVCAGALAVAAGPWLSRISGASVSGDVRVAIALAAVSIAVALQAGLLQSLLRGIQRFEDVGRVMLATSAMVPLASYAAVRLWGDLVSLVAANLIANLAALTMLFLIARRHLPLTIVPPRCQGDRLREMVAFGGWTSLGRLAMLLMLQLDRLLVALLGSVTGLAYYAVAAQLASRVTLPGVTSANLFFAKASWLRASDRGDDLWQQHEAMRRMLVVATLGLALPLVTFGPAFLQAWIGSEMRAAGGPILIMLTIGHAIVSVGSIDAAVLEASGRPDLTAKTMVAWAAISTGIGALLYWWLNAVAIAAAVAVWLTGVGLTTIVLRRRLLGSPRGSSDRRVLAGVGVALGVSVAIKTLFDPLLSSLVVVVIAMFVAGAVVVLVGSFTILQRSDRRLLLSRAEMTQPGGVSLTPAGAPVR